MNTSSENPHQKDRLGPAIFYSIVFHAVLFVVFAVRAVFFPSEPMILENAIRVDMVALPDKISKKAPLPPPPKEEEPPAPPKPKPKPKVQAKPKPKPKPVAKPQGPKVNLNKAKKDQQAALKRLEALAKLEEMAKAEESTTDEEEVAVEQTAAVIKGNQVSKGNSLTGLDRLDHQQYLLTIDQVVRGHWTLPTWLANANLSARVHLYIDSRGYVVKKELIRSSDNQVYDERVMLAIEQSSPLPPPPSNLADLLAVQGVTLDFTWK